MKSLTNTHCLSRKFNKLRLKKKKTITKADHSEESQAKCQLSLPPRSSVDPLKRITELVTAQSGKRKSSFMRLVTTGETEGGGDVIRAQWSGLPEGSWNQHGFFLVVAGVKEEIHLLPEIIPKAEKEK